jgi:hypothetical protein
MTTLKLDLVKLKNDLAESLTRGDSKVFVSLSSYDVPQSLTVQKGGRPGFIRVRFTYSDQEQDDVRPLGNGLTMLVGRNSGKVLGFDIKVQAPAHELAAQIVRGVRNEESQPNLRDNQRMNYQLIRRVVGDRLEPLLALP